MAKRYGQLIDLVGKVRPRAIVEIGTHRGARAVLMVTAAMTYVDEVAYVGYDIFEHGGEAFQRAALNGKGMATEAEAKTAMGDLRRKFDKRFSWTLVVGDTRSTLKGRDIQADFVFIDGDHRVDTIRSDYDAVQRSRCVVFDDFYVDGGDEPRPSSDQYGCNALVEEIRQEIPPYVGRRVEVLPVTDPCNDGGRIRMAVVQWKSP